MAHLIDKDALVAEIIRRKKGKEWGYSTGEAEAAYQDAVDDVLSIIDSMQEEPVSEELEKEINIRMGCNAFPEGTNITPLPKAMKIVEETANHFANWQKEKIMKGAVDIEICDSGCAKGLQFIPIWQFTDKYNDGDKVKLIIVKGGLTMEYEEMTIKVVKPIAYIEHKPTKLRIGVYHPIGWFRRLMLRLFFGLEYHKED